jgi:hypothetical protein
MSDNIPGLIAAINDGADPAHGDLTPAVHALVRLGLPALPAVLPLLESDDRWTRLRAQRVLEGTTRKWVRERTPEWPMTRKADYAWIELWQGNGNYDWEAPEDQRAASLARWRAWLGAYGQPGR